MTVTSLALRLLSVLSHFILSQEAHLLTHKTTSSEAAVLVWKLEWPGPYVLYAWEALYPKAKLHEGDQPV